MNVSQQNQNPKRDKAMKRNLKTISDTLHAIAQNIAKTIAENALNAYESMTDSEVTCVHPLTEQGNPDAYTARALILGLDLDAIFETLNAQSIKERLPKIRRNVRHALSEQRQSSRNTPTRAEIIKAWQKEETRLGKFINLDEDTLKAFSTCPLNMLEESVRAKISQS